MNETKTQKVWWRWQFERGSTDAEKATNNVEDTKIGFEANKTAEPNVEVQADVILTQAD